MILRVLLPIVEPRGAYFTTPMYLHQKYAVHRLIRGGVAVSVRVFYLREFLV